MPRPLSLGQALELGLGEERKQNKSLPDSSSNSAHSSSTHSNSTYSSSAHSHSTQRERQTTKEQNGMKRKRPTLKGETKKSKES
ncbi:hypothetical protein PGIGA_G00123260 [Pangasianodon gigas]|uniref:Uncharacterized protein n=1 Tax=Pangasianodon gigas TaxID=30993 RepID=A0ACC5XHC2_PANGG|nr:hypothetical protein [Pangasianodon gigas]